ncbi:MAG: hypothetical protein ACJAWH_001377 [Maribacter sp.]
MTGQLLWQEYYAKHPDSFKLSGFKYWYNKWTKDVFAVMHFTCETLGAKIGKQKRSQHMKNENKKTYCSISIASKPTSSPPLKQLVTSIGLQQTSQSSM